MRLVQKVPASTNDGKYILHKWPVSILNFLAGFRGARDSNKIQKSVCMAYVKHFMACFPLPLWRHVCVSKSRTFRTKWERCFFIKKTQLSIFSRHTHLTTSSPRQRNKCRTFRSHQSWRRVYSLKRQRPRSGKALNCICIILLRPSWVRVYQTTYLTARARTRVRISLGRYMILSGTLYCFWVCKEGLNIFRLASLMPEN